MPRTRCNSDRTIVTQEINNAMIVLYQRPSNSDCTQIVFTELHLDLDSTANNRNTPFASTDDAINATVFKGGFLNGRL